MCIRDRYTIAQIERVKHLKPKFSEYEIISKLAYHFLRDIQLAVCTQGIKTVEEFLILVTQAENITQGSNTKHNVQPHVNYNYDNYNANYKPQMHNTHTRSNDNISQVTVTKTGEISQEK